jgi:L-alanine-DL-glutamate epimerase-like enolase superfamily enzyme
MRHRLHVRGHGDRAIVKDKLAPLVVGAAAMAVPASWLAMARSIRNLGRPGIASMAISAVDVALWDLKARLLDTSLLGLLGKIRDHVPVYGSGGFTSYSLQQLQNQLSGWAAAGMRWVSNISTTIRGSNRCSLRARS